MTTRIAAGVATKKKSIIWSRRWSSLVPGSADIGVGMVSDYDQAAFLIGACFDNSGINVVNTLNNSNFTPHPALSALLDWLSRRGGNTLIRNAAVRARGILSGWSARNREKAPQLEFFLEEDASS